MAFDVEFTHQFGEWWDTLTEDGQEALNSVVELLEEQGPLLRRPVVGEILGEIHHMKELRAGTIRVVFAFDPRRTAILLFGGDKGRGEVSKQWYATAIPEAERLYEEHLRELSDEGLL